MKKIIFLLAIIILSSCVLTEERYPEKTINVKINNIFEVNTESGNLTEI